MKDIIDATNGIHGWLTRREACGLYDLVGKASGNIVEIGAWKGLSTSWLLVAAYRSGKQLTTIDHFNGSSEHRTRGPIDTYPEFCQNMRSIQRQFNIPDSCLNVLKMNSVQAARCFENNSVGLLFIDGSHEYELVKADWEAWKSKVSGITALHDIDFPGPKRLLSEICLNANIIDNLAWFYYDENSDSGLHQSKLVA